jgi:molybdenum cofactor biosynthesis enzyme MoaA
VCYFFYTSQDNVLNLNFETSCANIETLSIDMTKAFDADDLPALLRLNKEINIQLQAIRIDELTDKQKIQYKPLLEKFHQTHRMILQRCAKDFKETEAELSLLRKQQSAGSIYQQVQDGQ